MLADIVPADLVFAAVLSDVFGPGVERVVRRGVGEVEEEGLVLALVFVEPVDGIAGEGVGVVKFLVGAGVAHDDLVLDGPAADARLEVDVNVLQKVRRNVI